MNKVFIAIGALVFVVTGLVALVSIHRGSGLVLPPIKSDSYKKDQPVALKLNKITSQHTQVPYSFALLEGVCKTEKQSEQENLGDIIMGDVSVEHPGYRVRLLFFVASAADLGPRANIPNKNTDSLWPKCRLRSRMRSAEAQVRSVVDLAAACY